jgi:rubrerythrin
MSTDGIDFATLGLRDALDLAILIEEEATERYEELAAQMDAHHTPEVAAFFRAMMANEARHGAQLAERRTSLFGAEPSAVSRAMLWDVEAPGYDEVRAFMSLRDALAVARRAEQRAGAFFAAALPRIHDPAVKRLFEELYAEAEAHERLVEAEWAKLPPETPLRLADVEDEPVAQ